MKKLLSLALSLTLLFSLATVLAVPAAAVDGEWNVVYGADYYQPDYADEEPSLCGYEYTDDGFHTIPTGAWEASNPYLSVQTKNKVDLKEGVYMEVRIDDFTYASDKWFNLHIWDSIGIVPGSNDPKYGAGVQNLIRPSDSPDGTTPGVISGATWYTNQFTTAGSSTFTADQNRNTEDGKPILAMTLTWDGATYALDINGGAAPKAVIDFMNQKWGGNDSEAYIGIDAQNANKGGKCEITILKFGTDKDSATVPMGDDYAEPINNNIPFAEIIDPSTVPANEPAIFMTADRENSDTKNQLKASNGASSTVNSDGSLHVVAETSSVTGAIYAVKNQVSYDIKDFPVAITVTKNFCTCNNADGSCDAFETAHYYIMAGDVLSSDAQWHTSILDMSYNSYAVENAEGKTDTYLYFFCDFSEEFAEPMEGRINGIRFDVSGLDTSTKGSNEFDIMFTAFFKNTDEAEAYVENYVKNLGWTEKPNPATCNHQAITIPGSPATCVSKGLTAGQKCAACDTVLVEQVVTPATGHKVVIIPGRPATCTSAGLTEGRGCSACSDVLVKQAVIDATGHTAVTIPGRSATCVSEGLTAGQKCAVCDTVLVEQVVTPATGHTAVTVSGYAATPDAPGLTDGERCSLCNAVIVAQEVIPPTEDQSDPVESATAKAEEQTENPGNTSSPGANIGIIFIIGAAAILIGIAVLIICIVVTRKKRRAAMLRQQQLGESGSKTLPLKMRKKR